MSSTIFTSLLLLGLFGTLLAATIAIPEREPANVSCHSDDDCPNDECCVLGASRYSIPHCSPMKKKAEICRPTNEKINTTLHYPNNSKLTVSGVSFILCPCNHELTCDPREGVCT